MLPVLTGCLLALGSGVSIAQAKSRHQVDARGAISLSTSGVKIELWGSPFKHCRGTLEQLPDKMGRLRASCTHGRIVVRTRETNASGSKGTWRVTSGSGRYRNATGSGRYSGSFTTFKIRFRGTARY